MQISVFLNSRTQSCPLAALSLPPTLVPVFCPSWGGKNLIVWPSLLFVYHLPESFQNQRDHPLLMIPLWFPPLTRQRPDSLLWHSRPLHCLGWPRQLHKPCLWIGSPSFASEVVLLQCILCLTGVLSCCESSQPPSLYNTLSYPYWFCIFFYLSFRLNPGLFCDSCSGPHCWLAQPSLCHL